MLCLLWVLGVRINTTPSMPYGVYQYVQRDAEKGDMVALCPPAPWGALGKERGYTGEGLCDDGSRALLKIVAGVENDTVSFNCGHIQINGKIVQASGIRITDSKGRPLLSSLSAGSIPVGMALVLAPVSDSFDGRYFGLVPLYSLRKVRTLFTL